MADNQCALVGIRTPNLLIRSQVLYPIELRMHFPLIGSAKVDRKMTYVNLIAGKICFSLHQEGTNALHRVRRAAQFVLTVSFLFELMVEVGVERLI